MAKKHESEAPIRQLARKWVESTGADSHTGQIADYYAFKRWAEQNGGAVYWSGFVYDTMPERWFNEELGQTDWF